ncbi:MAG: hypothetical protein R2865_12605 [Deinococcales bacterium]
MSGARAIMSANPCQALASNNVHTLKLKTPLFSPYLAQLPYLNLSRDDAEEVYQPFAFSGQPLSLQGVPSQPQTEAKILAALWQSSLSYLSTECEGHVLGGGMLKLEPSEAKNCLILLPNLSKASLSRHSEAIDEMLRAGHYQEAQHYADEHFLKAVGLVEKEICLLKEGIKTLRARRNMG